MSCFDGTKRLWGCQNRRPRGQGRAQKKWCLSGYNRYNVENSGRRVPNPLERKNDHAGSALS